MADEQYGLSGLLKKLQRFIDVIVARAWSMRAVEMRACRDLNIGLFLEYVVGNIEVHWTGTTGHHGIHRLAQGKRQHVYTCRLKGAFHHGTQHLREVRLIVFV